MERIHTILDFWFKNQKNWFAKKPEFDSLILSNFQSDYNKALAGQYDYWKTVPIGSLALVILLDQFSRNMFRDSPNSFATDNLALSIAETALSNNQDLELSHTQRMFLYMPFMHSESLDMQTKGLDLFYLIKESLPNTYEFAIKHYEIIKKFGRFPHRNLILGRSSTEEEIEFLKQPDSSF